MPWMTKRSPNANTHWVLDDGAAACSKLLNRHGEPLLAPLTSALTERDLSAHICRLCRWWLKRNPVDIEPGGPEPEGEPCACATCGVGQRVGPFVGNTRPAAKRKQWARPLSPPMRSLLAHLQECGGCWLVDDPKRFSLQTIIAAEEKLYVTTGFANGDLAHVEITPAGIAAHPMTLR